MWRKGLLCSRPFLLQLFNCEDHVLFRSCSPKATLLLRVNLFCCKLESGKGNMGSDLPHKAEQGDATVVVSQCSLLCICTVSCTWYRPGGHLPCSNKGGCEDVAVMTVSHVW